MNLLHIIKKVILKKFENSKIIYKKEWMKSRKWTTKRYKMKDINYKKNLNKINKNI